MTGPRHPAKWSKALLPHIVELTTEERMLRGEPLRILDPFAGQGLPTLRRVLSSHDVDDLVGVELEAEWAEQDDTGRTIVGDSTDLPAEWDDEFDVVISSPCYGNRMADSHEARDTCKACDGTGRTSVAECPTCKGEGLSRRNTYRHALGRPLTEGNAGAMQWGSEYRELHAAVMREVIRVLAPGGLILWNVSNHVRNGAVIAVAEWHMNEWIVQGCTLNEVRRVKTPRQRMGANGAARVDGELLMALRSPTTRRLL